MTTRDARSLTAGQRDRLDGVGDDGDAGDVPLSGPPPFASLYFFQHSGQRQRAIHVPSGSLSRVTRQPCVGEMSV